MAKTNPTKKNAPAASGDGATPSKPAVQRAADVVAAVTAPIVENAAKLTRLVKRKAGAARAAAKKAVAPVAPAPQAGGDFSGDGNAVSASVPPFPEAPPPAISPKSRRTAKDKPSTTTAPAVPAVGPAPAPPPPIPGVTKPPAKVKPEGRAKATKVKVPSPAKSIGANPQKEGFTNDDVALRAYFIAQKRHAEGRHGNPESDWLEAEAALRAEYGAGK